MPVLPDSDAPAPSPSDLIPWVPAGDLNCTPCDIDPLVIAKSATIIADNLSGHRFGQRSLRLRPSALTAGCHCGDGRSYAWGFGFLGLITSGLWFSGCGCSRATQIRFSEPVNYVATVKVDGVLLDASDWTLYGDSRLVRVDGGTFPCCQDLRRNPDADYGTLEVACTIGAPPDEMAQLAVQEIACELTKAFDDPAACRLPRRTQSITRQQLSVTFPNPSNAYSQGFTSLPVVDLWLASLDADQQRRGGRVVDLTSQTAWRPPAP